MVVCAGGGRPDALPSVAVAPAERTPQTPISASQLAPTCPHPLASCVPIGKRHGSLTVPYRGSPIGQINNHTTFPLPLCCFAHIVVLVSVSVCVCLCVLAPPFSDDGQFVPARQGCRTKRNTGGKQGTTRLCAYVSNAAASPLLGSIGVFSLLAVACHQEQMDNNAIMNRQVDQFSPFNT